MTAKRRDSKQNASNSFQSPGPRRLDAFRRAVLDLLSAADYQPLTPRDIVQELGAPDHLHDVGDALDSLFDDGTLVELKRKGVALARSVDLVAGDIRFLKSGHGIVTSTDGLRTVFVPNGETSTALPGDRVVVRLHDQDRDRKRGAFEEASGTVIRVEERRMLTVVGTLKRQTHMFYVKPMHSSMTHDIIVPPPERGELGDRVLVRLEEWTDAHISPEGVVVDVIGPADDPAFDTLAVIQSHNLPMEFPAECILEAERQSITEKDIAKRKDFRKRYVFTIDPATARDFDDAISLEKVAGGKWRLGVHIADVSHYVQPGSALDKEAYSRGNSCYFPDTVIPMLPEQLSNGLCSLQPNTDRFAFSAFMTLDADGNVLKAEFAETVIHSQLRLSYEQAMEAIETPDGAAFPDAGMDKKQVAHLKQVHALTMQIRRNRFAKGALNMDLPEVRFSIGEDGRIDDVIRVVNDDSHQLIEECMLMANEAVCAHLCSKGIPHLHRVHEEPEAESLEVLQAMFLQAGVEVGDLTDRHEMSALLLRIADYPQATAWYSSVLRSFKRARYAVPALGHYGLAKEHYTHFTSPIRRYADLVVHRTLKAALLKKKGPYTADFMHDIANQCSNREDIATQAERELVDLKRVRFFQEQLDSGKPREYTAVVNEVRNFGLFIFLPDVQTTGLVHVSELSNDFYDFNPQRLELVGRAHGTRFAVGETLQVQIAHVDSDRRMLDFTIVATNGGGSSGRNERRGGRGNSGGGGGDSRSSGNRSDDSRSSGGSGGGGGGRNRRSRRSSEKRSDLTTTGEAKGKAHGGTPKKVKSGGATSSGTAKPKSSDGNAYPPGADKPKSKRKRRRR